MAKRELSSTLKNLKFMQRAREKEEIVKKEEEKERKIITPISGNKKCVVIMEGDPKPEAVSGRMSFQNFNPSIDKLNEEHEETHKHRLFTTSSADGNGMNVSRENEASGYGNDGLNKNQESDTSEDLQRKKQKLEEDSQGSYLSPSNSVGRNGSQSSLDEGKNSQQGRARLDWRLLRPPTGRTKRS